MSKIERLRREAPSSVRAFQALRTLNKRAALRTEYATYKRRYLFSGSALMWTWKLTCPTLDGVYIVVSGGKHCELHWNSSNAGYGLQLMTGSTAEISAWFRETLAVDVVFEEVV